MLCKEFGLPVYNLVGSIETEYAIGGGKPIVTLKSKGGIRHRAAYTGTAVLLFHWVQEGKTQTWRFDPSILNPQLIQPEETTNSEGTQLLSFTLRDLVPAAGFLRGRWEGAFVAPAIHIDVPLGKDIWIFLLHSPWFPLKLSLTRSTLSLNRDNLAANASLNPDDAGGFSATISSPGDSFKRVSLTMKRKIAQFLSEELITQVEAGTSTQVWKPIIRNFDLCLVTYGQMGMGQLSEIARGLGADFSPGFLGPGWLRGEYVLCDGPLTEYSLTMTGDLGLFRHEEDSVGATLAW